MSTARLRATADGLRRAPKALVADASKAAAIEIRKALRADAGGDAALSGIPRAKLAVKVDVRDFRSDAVAELTPGGSLGARGVWGILEGGATAHTIPRNGRARRMNLDGRWVTGPIRHPGAPAKHTWTRIIPKAIESATAEAHRSFTKAVG